MSSIVKPFGRARALRVKSLSALSTHPALVASSRAPAYRRTFASSASRRTHYQTLSVPHNASRAQIKTSYYKLSKQYHPDLTQDPKSKETFQRVSEAYAVLADDRQRRAYDRSLAESAGPHRHHSPAGNAFHTYHADPSWAYETRRRPGATHAWDNARRPGSAGYKHPGHKQHTGTPPPYGSYSQSQTHPESGQHYNPDPWASPGATRSSQFTRGAKMTDIDRVNQVSSFWRAAQVFTLVMVVAMVGGGYRANA